MYNIVGYFADNKKVKSVEGFKIGTMTDTKQNKMGIMPINKLLLTMSLPMMVSMLVQALYNIVDSVFVAQISENAFTAVSMAFPVQNLMISVASGTAVGVNALLSRYLGAKEYEGASSVARHGIMLVFISYIIFALLGFFFSEMFFKAQTDNAEILECGTTYLKVCTVMSFGLFGQIIFERLLVSTGKTLFSMTSQIVGAVTNIILDPIMIFGLFGFPKLGVAGAALATVVGQVFGCILALLFNVFKNKEISIGFGNFKFSLKTVGNIYSIGVPSIIMMSITSVTVFALNKILMAFSSTAVAVLGAYFKFQSFVFMPIFGLNNGMIPIVAYNYGAKNKERVLKTIKCALLYAVCIMAIGIFVFWVFPDKLLLMFKAKGDMMTFGIEALRIISLSFTFAGVCIIISSVFQALGHGVSSMIMSIIRQIVVLIPAAYLLSLTGYVGAVWWSYPIAEIASVVTGLIFLKKIYKTTIANMEAGTDEV